MSPSRSHFLLYPSLLFPFPCWFPAATACWWCGLPRAPAPFFSPTSSGHERRFLARRRATRQLDLDGIAHQNLDEVLADLPRDRAERICLVAARPRSKEVFMIGKAPVTTPSTSILSSRTLRCARALGFEVLLLLLRVEDHRRVLAGAGRARRPRRRTPAARRRVRGRRRRVAMGRACQLDRSMRGALCARLCKRAYSGFQAFELGSPLARPHALHHRREKGYAPGLRVQRCELSCSLPSRR